MTSSKLALPPEKRTQRQQEFEQLVSSLPQVIANHNIQGLLIPGDLWDHEKLDRSDTKLLKTFQILYTTLCNLSIPAIITPGNHDFYGPSSFYSPMVLQSLGLAPWPDHILIFSEPKFNTAWVPGWDGKIQVTGRAFDDNTLLHPDNTHRQIRLLEELSPRMPTETLDLLLFHGARDDFNPAKEKLTAPFSQQELVSLNFDYAAIGHYHTFETFCDMSGHIKGAYAGCPFGRGLDETGPKYAIIGDLTKEGTEPAQVTLEKISLDKRQIVSRSIPITGQTSFEEIETWVLQSLQTAAQPDDLIYCELHGQIPAGSKAPWEKLEAKLNESFFYAKLDTSKVKETYHLDDYRHDRHSLEGRYLAALDAKIQQSQSDEERKLLEQALYLGLDALTGIGVRTP